jgi:hypothetical protein
VGKAVDPRRKRGVDLVQLASVVPEESATVVRVGEHPGHLGEVVQVLRGVVGMGEVRRPEEPVGSEALGHRGDRPLVGIARDPDPLPEVVARLALERYAGADERVRVHRVDAIEPVADPAATGLEHDDLGPREPVEHAVVEQGRELVPHSVGRGHGGEQAQLPHVLPRSHARSLGPLGLERGMDGERDVQLLRGVEHRVVVGMAQRAGVVGEGAHIGTLRSFPVGADELRGRRLRVGE